jgi:predicted negative regulator of RcsB-dependent stress response
MGIMRRLLSTIVFGFLILSTQAQNIKEQFETGKQYFDQEQYALAKNTFAKITGAEGNNDYVQWASYYFAVAAYYSNDLTSARNMFRQILDKYPYWAVKGEVNFWLAYIYASEGKLKNTFDYLYRITDSALAEDIDALKYSAVAASSDIDELKATLSAFSSESIVASRLAEVVLAQPKAQQDIALLSQLKENYDLKIKPSIAGIEASPKKKVYNVGLFLPFYYRSDSASLLRVERNWTASLYYGLKLGIDKLKDEGVYINLLTYDTRGTQDLNEIIEADQLGDLDLIIGPVTQSSIELVAPMAKEKKINMVNPLSANSEITEDNPFAYLYYPSNESLARRAASYAVEHFTDNKNAAIFYSGMADKTRADEYRTLIEKDSFDVVIYEGVLPNESVNIQQLLLDEEEVDRDSIQIAAMMAEMDSLRWSGAANWKKYDERDFVYDALKILPDSIGHIFVASDYSSLVTSALSGIDARPDTIDLITSSRFLAAEQSISLDQLERLDVVLLGSNFIAYDAATVDEFRERFFAKYLTSPTKEETLGDAYIGYDLMVNFGRLLGQFGKYFQIGLASTEDVQGELIEAFNYRFTQDNNFIPYLKVRDAKIELRREETNENRP